MSKGSRTEFKKPLRSTKNQLMNLCIKKHIIHHHVLFFGRIKTYWKQTEAELCQANVKLASSSSKLRLLAQKEIKVVFPFNINRGSLPFKSVCVPFAKKIQLFFHLPKIWGRLLILDLLYSCRVIWSTFTDKLKLRLTQHLV